MKKQKPIIHINPPPPDRRCECCRRHISELKPFGGAGDWEILREHYFLKLSEMKVMVRLEQVGDCIILSEKDALKMRNKK